MSGRQSFLPQPINSQSGSSGGSGSSKTPKAHSPYDWDFIERVLQPRSIMISQPYYVKAHMYFNVDEPRGDRIQHYTGRMKAPASSVWLDERDDFIAKIAEGYCVMSQRRMCEAEFKSFAKEMIFKRERRVQDPQQAGDERCWRTERLLEPLIKATDLWERPPLVGKEHTKIGYASHTAYKFDLRPDCAYWLSLQALSAEYKDRFQEHTLVVYDTLTCPYLTIEFKRDESAMQAALNKVAAAAAIALYNRYLLRKQSLDCAKQKWDEEHAKPLKHYGITFTGSCYSIWCISMQLTNRYAWSGCRMNRVFFSDCTNPRSVRDLIDWINEIHCWGLTVHGPECQEDIKRSMKAAEGFTGIRVSDVLPLVSSDELDS
ncbi:MAG: hypothetical protein Q9191_007429 [Dirinaria sp. TL-2023a]